jgi:hypothetical protein
VEYFTKRCLVWLPEGACREVDPVAVRSERECKVGDRFLLTLIKAYFGAMERVALLLCGAKSSPQVTSREPRVRKSCDRWPQSPLGRPTRS